MAHTRRKYTMVPETSAQATWALEDGEGVEPCCCMPYRHDPLWWWPPSKWFEDAWGVGTPAGVAAKACSAVRVTLTRAHEFATIFLRNPALFGFYIVLGLMASVPSLTAQFLLKDTFQLQPETMKMWGTCVVLPWSLKLLFAFSSDRWTLCGFHRRYYIVAGSTLGAIGWFLAALCVLRRTSRMDAGQTSFHDTEISLGSFATFTLAMVVVNLGIAGADACVNAALMDYIVKTRDAPGVQSVKVFGQSTGSLTGVLLGAWFVTSVPAGITLLCMAGMSALIALLGYLIPERGSGDRAGDGLDPALATTPTQTRPQKPLRAHLVDVWNLVGSPKVRRVLLFLVVVTLPPDSGTAMFYFLTERLAFTQGFISVVSIVTALCGIFGTFLYFAKLQNVPFRTLFVIVFVVCSPLGFMQILLVTRTNEVLGIPDKLFLLGDDALQAITVSIIQTPILVIIADACPRNLEGTAYELVNSVSNLCLIASSFMGTWLMDAVGISRTNFDNMVLLLLITNTLNMMPIAFTWCLPGGRVRRDANGRTVPIEDEGTVGVEGFRDSEADSVDSPMTRRLVSGILLTASLAQPRGTLWALQSQEKFLRSGASRRRHVAVCAVTEPAQTTDWALCAGLGHAQSQTIGQPGNGDGFRLQPFLPGDKVVEAGGRRNRNHTSFHYAVATAERASDINAMRSWLVADDERKRRRAAQTPRL